MKKFITISTVVLFLLVGAVLILPVIFKDDIFDAVKTEANKNLNAKVDFGDFSLTLFKSFPDFTLTIEDVGVEGIENFEGVKLANIKQVEVTIDVMSAIKGEQIKVKSFGLIEPSIKVMVTENGDANYNIAKETQAEDSKDQEATTDQPGKFSVGIQHYYIRNANLIYEDKLGKMYAQIKQLTHQGNGDFTQDIVMLNTQTGVEAISVEMDGVNYLNNAELDVKFDLEMDMPNNKFTFKDNEIRLNQLVLGFDGWIATAADAIGMDLSFEAKQTEFKSILSLIPAVYSKDFASVKTAGKLALNGTAKGIYEGEQLPAFDVNLRIDDAMFKYPDLPSSVENIQVAVGLNNPGGSADQTLVDIQKFHVEIADNPVDVKMKVATPVSDANIEGAVKAQIDLSKLADVIPLDEGESYNGAVTADVTMQGRVSTIQNEDYENFELQGQLILQDMDYDSPELPYDTKIKVAYLNFSPKYVELSKFDCTLGKSDIHAAGSIENFVPYYFKEGEVLKGALEISSNLINLDELTGDKEKNEAETVNSESNQEEVESEVVEVPANIEFKLNVDIKNLIYDSIEITNINGGLAVKDQNVDLNALKMNMMKGGLILNGNYNTVNKMKPEADFDLKMDQWDLPTTFETFNTIQKLAPIAESANGKFSTQMKLALAMDNKMEPVLTSLNGGGELLTHNIEMDNSEGAIGKMADQLKMEQYKKQSLDNVNVSFKIIDGKLFVEPFSVTMGESNATIYGWNAVDKTMEYHVDMDIPTKELKLPTGGIMGQMFGMLGDRIKVPVLITGTVDKPKVSLDLMGAVKNSATGNAAKANLEKKAKEEAEKLMKEAEERAQQEADKLKKEAEKRAKEEAEKLKKQAEERAKKEAEKAAKQAENELKKGLKGLFGK